MSNKIFLLILVWTTVFALWVWAAPPGNPPSGGGLIKWDETNNRITIAIDTIWVGAASLIDVNSRTLTGLPDPVNNRDAVHKKYVDDNYGGSNAQRLWGQGRPGVAVRNTAGECSNTRFSPAIKISRGDQSVHWDGAAAGCPKNWWVCAKDERDRNGSGTTGFGACGSGNTDSIICNPGAGGGDELQSQATANAWISNAGNNPKTGFLIGADGAEGSGNNKEVCSVYPVWCCKQ